jgi:type VI secretion system protein ImpH
LIAALRSEAYRFDFFQAVRLLRRAAEEQAEGDRAEQDSLRRRHPVGHDFAPKQEIVRFRVLPSLGFPSGAIREIHPPAPRPADPADGGPPEMITSFMGLTGPNGVLPRHYTTLVIDRVRRKDFALRDFLDLFHHRVISLFYRAWEKYRFAIAYERAAGDEAGQREDLFTCCLYCLIGLGTAGLRGRMALDDETLLYYGGHFAHWPRCALSLEIMLGDYFELPAEVRQFQGQWLYLSRDDQSSLPTLQQPEGLNCRLGTDVVVGERVWDVEGKFRVRLGPLSYGQFRRFTPAGDALPRLGQMVRAYAGPQFDFDVQPVLKAAEVPWCRLGGDGADPARAGWNTWVRSREFDHDVEDAIFRWEG